MPVHIVDLGWSPWFETRFTDRSSGSEPGRVVASYGPAYAVATEHGDVLASLPGRLKHAATGSAALPAIGDWVVLKGPIIDRVLERRTALTRKAAGRVTAEQVIAANLDLVLIVTAAVDEFNLRRLERYATVAWDSGAAPVVVLTKSDLAGSLEAILDQASAVVPGVPVLATSAVTGEGIEALRQQVAPGLTGVLVGSSGVGKSTLINRLLGQSVIATNALRRDGRGRHTTTRRELFAIPGGGLLIDTPGLREVQLWADEGSLDVAFDDIRLLAAGCRFTDCLHDHEPGCAVRRALADGALPPERLVSYRKLQRELRSVAIRADARLRREESKRWRAITRAARRRARPG